MKVWAVNRDSRDYGVWFGGSGRVAAVSLILGVLSLLALAPLCTPAVAATPLQYVEEFGPDGSDATSFAGAGPIAVDQNSDVIYVMDKSVGSLYKFDLDGNPVSFEGTAPYLSGNQLSGLTFPGDFGKGQVAVDSQNDVIYVTDENKVRAFQGNGEPHVFTAGPGIGTNEIGGFTELSGLAVDRTGNIYTTDRFRISVFSPSGDQITSSEPPVGGIQFTNLAIAPDGAVLVLTWGDLVHKVTPSEFPVTTSTTFTFQKTFLPDTGSSEGAMSVAINPLTDEVYSAGAAPVPRAARYDIDGTLLDTFAGPGQAGEVSFPTGVGVHSRTGKVFVADHPDPSRVELFQPRPAAPTIEFRFASDVGSNSATLGSKVNPNTLETTVEIEYGRDDCSGETCIHLLSADIGAGYSPEKLSTQPILGLQPNTTYHYRVVARNSLGTSERSGTFTTQELGLGFALPDSRVWELVSPPNKQGSLLQNRFGPMQAAADGDGMAYQSTLSIEPQPEGSRAPERSMVLAQRSDNTWQSRDITPPHGQAAVVGGGGNEFLGLNSDLTKALYEPRDAYHLSPAASGRTSYVRSNAAVPTYTPLITAKEGFANLPIGAAPGTEFGTPGREVKPVGANREFTAVVLQSQFPLVVNHEVNSLYRWSQTGGRLLPVSMLPQDQGGGVVGAVAGSGEGSDRNAVSADGSRIFWSQGFYTEVQSDLSGLYLRDFAAGETIRLDVPPSGTPGQGQSHPVFQGASPDGTVAFFTDSQQLTEGASPEGADLYRCQLPRSTATELNVCDLTNLTSSRVNAEESAEVLGISPGGAEDGSSLYFVARGILDEDPNQLGAKAAAGEPNLYHWREGSGVRYIATLGGADSRSWGIGGGTRGTAQGLTAASSPDGRYLAFMSERNLVGYDTRDADGGAPTGEIYRYDAAEESLSCVSCKPTGASPEGGMHADQVEISLVDPSDLLIGRSVAAVLPQTRKYTQSVYRPRAVLDNGRIFFNSFDALVPGDSNGQWDVYGFEPVGVGSCGASTAGAATVKSGEGCTSLLSSGTAGEEAAFLDASVTGDDVFFLTTARLSVTDVDDEYDVYDARVGGVVAELEEHPQCRGEACQPPASAPNDPTPGTATLEGPADPKARAKRCPQGKHKIRRKGRVRCVKRKSGKSRGSQRQAGTRPGSSR